MCRLCRVLYLHLWPSSASIDTAAAGAAAAAAITITAIFDFRALELLFGHFVRVHFWHGHQKWFSLPLHHFDGDRRSMNNRFEWGKINLFYVVRHLMRILNKTNMRQIGLQFDSRFRPIGRYVRHILALKSHAAATIAIEPSLRNTVSILTPLLRRRRSDISRVSLRFQRSKSNENM